MQDFEPFATFRRFCLPYSGCVPLGAYGADTLKPIDVCSDCKEVTVLVCKKPRHGLKQLASTDKKTGVVNGKSKLLAKSQAYPPRFGKAVASLYRDIMAKNTIKRVFPEWAKEFGLSLA